MRDGRPTECACPEGRHRPKARGDRSRDRGTGPAAARQPGRAPDHVRQQGLPMPRRPATAARALPDLDPQGRQQDRHPDPGHRAGRRPTPAPRQRQTTTRTDIRTREPHPSTTQGRPRSAGPRSCAVDGSILYRYACVTSTRVIVPCTPDNACTVNHHQPSLPRGDMYSKPESRPARAFAEQMQLSGDATDPQVLAQDAVGAAIACRRELATLGH